MFQPGFDYYDEVVVESQGRVRAVRTRAGVVQYQDPDVRYLRHYADGRTKPIHNPFIRQNVGVSRLEYDFETNTVRDSFGEQVGLAHLRLPRSGRVVSFLNNQGVVTKRARYMRLTVDPRQYRPKPNQEILERIVIVDKDGNLVVRETSYGYGKKYDKARKGKWWRAQVQSATGKARGDEDYYKAWQEAVISRTFLVKTTT